MSEERDISAEAFDDVMTEKNVVILGQGGTGKSSLIHSIMDFFGDETVLCAPTGLAAINIGGQTAHSTFRMPLHIPEEEDLKVDAKVRKLFGVRSPVRRIVFDEVGMLTSGHLWYIDEVLRMTRRSDKPFGGLQCILVGDFLQLGAVIKPAERKHYFAIHGYPEVFSYKAWHNFDFRIHNLTDVHRQNDPQFKAVLSRIRLGEQTQNDLDYLNQRVIPNTADSPSVCLTNKRCANINDIRYNALPGPEKVYVGFKTGEFKEWPVPEKIALKIGAKVIICANVYKKDPSNGEEAIVHINGDIGTVVKMNQTHIIVDTDRAGKVKVKPYNYYKYRNEKIDGKIKQIEIGAYNQVPVKLAYAMTTHKIQGQTLKSMHLDLEWDSYRAYASPMERANRDGFLQGLPYVGLSRVTSLEGLTLERAILMTDIRVNPRAIAFMKALEVLATPLCNATSPSGDKEVQNEENTV